MRLIDADKVLNIVVAYCPDDDGSCSKAGIDLREMLDEIEALPEIDAKPVKHGHWIDGLGDEWHCSVCHDYTFSQRPPYCEHCGSIMDGEKVDAGEYQVVKHGQWEFVHYDPDYLVFSGTCTACKKKHESTDNVGKLPFCPHCGAQMNGVKAPVLISADEDGESV